MANNCLGCEHSFIEDIWGECKCKLKNHYVINKDHIEAVGKIRKDGELVDCPDYVYCKGPSER